MKKISNSLVGEHFTNEIPFENYSGTLMGLRNPNQIVIGKLDEREISRLRIDTDTAGIRYVVISYDTPIAWVTRSGWTYRVEQYLGHRSQSHKRLLD